MESSTPILLAISGGVDSMVLWHQCLQRFGTEGVAIAHVDFSLRGQDSTDDAAFVRDMADKWGQVCHIQKYDTKTYVHEQGLGIQEAARNLRYTWFEELRQAYGYRALATAHHRDDSIETFFINLLRGAGPQGLRGIKSDDEKGLLRPLLNMSKSEILAYAHRHEIPWREDASNQNTDYFRNRVRAELIPLLSDLRPGFEKVMERNMLIQSGVYELLQKHVCDYRNEYVKDLAEDIWTIEESGQAHEGLYLHELLSPYGFHWSAIQDLLESEANGKQIFAPHHVLSRHKGLLRLEPRIKVDKREYEANNLEEVLGLSFICEAQYQDGLPKNKAPEKHVGFFGESLQFPLKFRPWKKGDRMSPLGMKGSKTISDILRESGLSIEERRHVKVMLSEGKIAWLIGHRISEEFKVNEGESALVLRFEPQSG